MSNISEYPDHFKIAKAEETMSSQVENENKTTV